MNTKELEAKILELEDEVRRQTRNAKACLRKAHNAHYRLKLSYYENENLKKGLLNQGLKEPPAFCPKFFPWLVTWTEKNDNWEPVRKGMVVFAEMSKDVYDRCFHDEDALLDDEAYRSSKVIGLGPYLEEYNTEEFEIVEEGEMK